MHDAIRGGMAGHPLVQDAEGRELLHGEGSGAVAVVVDVEVPLHVARAHVGDHVRRSGGSSRSRIPARDSGSAACTSGSGSPAALTTGRRSSGEPRRDAGRAHLFCCMMLGAMRRLRITRARLSAFRRSPRGRARAAAPPRGRGARGGRSCASRNRARSSTG
jgi:hypothetical protein